LKTTTKTKQKICVPLIIWVGFKEKKSCRIEVAGGDNVDKK
jgi:hypothetical protein